MAIKIEKKVKQKSIRKFPFPDMKVGESIFIENRTDSGTILTAARSYSLRNHNGEWKFSSQKENGGVRIFRIA